MPTRASANSAGKEDQSVNLRDPSPAASSTSAQFPALGRASVNPVRLRGADVLHLQRTIGNRATERWVRGLARPAHRPAAAGSLIQRAIDKGGFETKMRKERPLSISFDVLAQDERYKSLMRRIKRYNNAEDLEKLDSVQRALDKFSTIEQADFVNAFGFLTQQIEQEKRRLQFGKILKSSKEPPPLREEPFSFSPPPFEKKGSRQKPPPLHFDEPISISSPNESLESIFGGSNLSGQRTPPPLRFESGLRTPPPLDFDEPLVISAQNESLDSIFGRSNFSGQITPPPLREEPPPLREEPFSFAPSNSKSPQSKPFKSGHKTPSHRQSEFIIEPDWKKPPPLLEEFFQERDEIEEKKEPRPYEQRVAERFSLQTSQIFLKLWNTASMPDKQRIQELFSTDTHLKNLSSLEYILEALDPQHRLEHRMGLESYALEWLQSPTEEYFYDWLTKTRADLPPMGNVDYFDEQTRARYELRLGWSIGYEQSREPLEGENIYALSQGKKFYASQGKATDKGIVHHSSFLAGAAVSGAGHMTFKTPGELSAIDVNSGHYKPGARQMFTTLDALDRGGVELAGVQARPELSGGTFDAEEWLFEQRRFRF